MLKVKPGALEGARITDPASGRTGASTTEPGAGLFFQLSLNGGAEYGRPTAGDRRLALKPNYPESPNHANFPSTVLKPGETFTSSTVMHFTVQYSTREAAGPDPVDLRKETTRLDERLSTPEPYAPSRSSVYCSFSA